MAGLLLRAGAKVNAANDLGATPLWIASLNGSTAMVRRLLRAGANPNAALLLGETPLMVASRGGQRRHRGAAARGRRQGQPPRRARPDRADVGGGAAPS